MPRANKTRIKLFDFMMSLLDEVEWQGEFIKAFKTSICDWANQCRFVVLFSILVRQFAACKCFVDCITLLE
jgi:hypothetical protein